MSDQRNFPFSSQYVRIVDKSYCFCMLEYPPKRCCSPAGNSSATFSEIMFSLPPTHTHIHAHTLSLTENYTIRKKSKYVLTLSPWMPEYRWFIYLFIFGSITSVCLDSNQLVSSTRMRPLQVWKDLRPNTMCISDYIFHLKLKLPGDSVEEIMYHLSYGLLFIVAYCFSCCSVSILPINLKQLNYF